MVSVICTWRSLSKVCHRGLAKKTTQLHTLFVLSNLWMAYRHLMCAQ